MTRRATQTNFFIVGAPRCGTTAMSSYLAEHGQVNFSDPKEPLFFCTDMSGVQAVQDVTDYEKHFFSMPSCDADTPLLRGEGSVWYLYSEAAIPNILAYNPDARFIVMLRNPVDLLLSLHQKLLLFLDENEPNFQKAWALQDFRDRGECIPETCRESKLLRYRSIGKLGAQVERMLKYVRRSHIHFITYDDFTCSQRDTYEQVLEFLGLEQDGRQVFPRVNANRKVLNRHLYKAISRPSDVVMKMVSIGKQVLGVDKLGVLTILRKKLTPEKPRVAIDFVLRSRLVEEFSDDVNLLGKLIEKDLTHWTRF